MGVEERLSDPRTASVSFVPGSRFASPRQEAYTLSDFVELSFEKPLNRTSQSAPETYVKSNPKAHHLQDSYRRQGDQILSNAVNDSDEVPGAFVVSGPR